MYTLFLSNNFSNVKEVSTHNSMAELHKEGKRLLREGAVCANGIPAREYAYLKDGNMVYRF